MREFQVPARFLKKVLEESDVVDKYRDPKTGQIVVHRIVTKTFNLDEANKSPYEGGASNFNLGIAPGATSRATLGGNKSDENSL